MEYINLQLEGVNVGAAGKFDVEFLHVAAVKWPELERAVKGLRGIMGSPDAHPHEPEQSQG